MLIAPADPPDFPALAELMHAAVHAVPEALYTASQRAAWSPRPMSADALAARLEGLELLVARTDGRPLGFTALHPSGHLDLLYVEPAAQRRGVGRALATAAVDRARALRLGRVFTEASAALRPLLTRLGFVVDREEQVTRGDAQLPRWRMSHRLRRLDAARRILVVGPSGAGKSTFARRLAVARAHVDLDTYAFVDQAGTRRPLADALARLRAPLESPTGVIVEGCYADLAQALGGPEDHLVWLDVPVETCLSHARARPWEPHKWPTAEMQDAFRPQLEAFIRGYPEDPSPVGRPAHAALFAGFPGVRERHVEPPSDD